MAHTHERPTPAPTDIVFFGTLGPDTRGCLDIHDHDTPCRHLCGGSPGVVGEQPPEEGYDEHDGPPEARWRIGNVVRMVKCAEPGGPYPTCFSVAEYANLSEENDWGLMNGGWAPKREYDLPFYCWTPLLGPETPRASFQWKGTTIDLTFTCPGCNTDLHVVAEFAYHVGCPRCQTGYAVDWYVPVERVI